MNYFITIYIYIVTDIDFSEPESFEFNGTMNTICQTLSILDDFALEGPHCFSLGEYTSTTPSGISVSDFNETVCIIDENGKWFKNNYAKNRCMHDDEDHPVFFCICLKTTNALYKICAKKKRVKV